VPLDQCREGRFPSLGKKAFEQLAVREAAAILWKRRHTQPLDHPAQTGSHSLHPENNRAFF